MGKPIDHAVRIPTLAGEDLEFYFDISPLDRNLNVVQVADNSIKREASPQVPILAPFQTAPHPVFVHPIVPVAPRVVVIEEQAPPEPEPVSCLFCIKIPLNPNFFSTFEHYFS